MGRPKSDESVFPMHSVNEALKVAQAITDKFAAKDTSPIILAQSIDKSPSSSDYKNLLSSSFRYGLTRGSWNGKSISLTDLGKKITMPSEPSVIMPSKLESLRNVELFNNLIERYDNHKIPETKYIQNVLINEFKVANERSEKCAEIFLQNIQDCNLLSKEFLVISKINSPVVVSPEQKDVEKEDEEVHKYSQDLERRC